MRLGKLFKIKLTLILGNSRLKNIEHIYKYVRNISDLIIFDYTM